MHKDDKDSLGTRIKGYEDCYRFYLPNRSALILRSDGKAWHSLTKKCERPFDLKLIHALNETAIFLCKEIQGAKIAYCQSDEINILIYQPEFKSQGWFVNNYNKIISISAALASSYFTSISEKVFGKQTLVQFDSRIFPVPLDEVVNVFEWRQQDATRNSIQMVAQANFSHKQLHGKSCNDLQEMLFQQKAINWNDFPICQKHGRCIVQKQIPREILIKGEKKEFVRNSWIVDEQIPIFHNDRNYIEQYLKFGE